MGVTTAIFGGQEVEVCIPGVPPRGRREPTEIRAEILRICGQPATKTTVVYDTHMNFRTVIPYLDQLLNAGLIEIVRIGRKRYYRTTDRGQEFEMVLRDIYRKLGC